MFQKILLRSSSNINASVWGSNKLLKENLHLMTNPNDINKIYFTVHEAWLPNLHYIP